MIKLLIVLMLSVLSHEVPTVKKGTSPADQVWRARIARVAAADVAVGSAGKLVDASTDTAILAAMQFYESRWRPGARGDCGIRGPHARLTCHSFGVMQINNGAVMQLPLIGRVIGEPRWQHPTRKLLQTLRGNVAAGYAFLRYYKQTCGGGPMVWLTAYGYGSCPHFRTHRHQRRYTSRGARWRWRLAQDLMAHPEVGAP